jgi:hypothetical protein
MMTTPFVALGLVASGFSGNLPDEWKQRLQCAKVHRGWRAGKLQKHARGAARGTVSRSTCVSRHSPPRLDEASCALVNFCSDDRLALGHEQKCIRHAREICIRCAASETS